MRSIVRILPGLLCFILFAESRVSGQPLVLSMDPVMKSTADGPSVGARERHSASPVQLARVPVLSDSALPAGVYTVGQAGSFPTIDSAFSKLAHDGILGDVTLTLIDTLYRALPGRRFELGPVAGAGSNARITIRPAVNTRVTIRGDSTAVFTFTNLKYLTLDGRSNPPSLSAGITVHALYNPAAPYNDCIAAWGDADHNQILYLTLKTDDFRNVSPGGAGCISFGNVGTSAVPDSNVIEGNLMSGVFGVWISGDGTSPPTRPRGNIIRGNTYGQITDLHGAWGIQSQICEGTLIEGNTIQYMRGTYQTTNNGRIWTIGINAYIDLSTTIRNNVVHAVYTSNDAELYGILGSGGTAGAGAGLLIYNNMVYDLQNASTGGRALVEGMCLWYNVNNQILYNTVYLSGAGANPQGVDALYLAPSVTNTTLRNNVFVNFYRQTAGVTPTALWVNGVVTSDYNDLCVDTTLANSRTARIGTTTQYRLFSEWQGAGYDPHSLSILPVFRAPHLHLDSTSGVSRQLNARATPVVGINADFDGQARHASTPDIGADEMWLTSDGMEGDVASVPQRCGLEQNYPNPFNPTTTIKFELPKSSVVRLSVYDMLGREVSVLVNERRDAGVHEVRCDARGLSSGVYLYRMQAGDFVQSKKLIVLK